MKDYSFCVQCTVHLARYLDTEYHFSFSLIGSNVGNLIGVCSEIHVICRSENSNNQRLHLILKHLPGINFPNSPGS